MRLRKFTDRMSRFIKREQKGFQIKGQMFAVCFDTVSVVKYNDIFNSSAAL